MDLAVALYGLGRLAVQDERETHAAAPVSKEVPSVSLARLAATAPGSAGP